jgi:hypothetical protein
MVSDLRRIRLLGYRSRIIQKETGGLYEENEGIIQNALVDGC